MKNKWKGDRLVTTGVVEYLLYTIKVGNKIYHYFGNVYQPACSYDLKSKTLNHKLSVASIKGDKFNKKICIRPNSKLMYISIDMPKNVYDKFNFDSFDYEKIFVVLDNAYKCNVEYYTTPNYKISNAIASSNNEGCLIIKYFSTKIIYNYLKYFSLIIKHLFYFIFSLFYLFKYLFIHII